MMTFSLFHSLHFRLVVLVGMAPVFPIAGWAAKSADRAAGSHQGSHLATPSGLRCDRKTEPLAIADERPEFSWNDGAASTVLKGVKQTAYEVRVSSGAESRVWDSGRVDGSATFGAMYAGPALEAQREYGWQVRVWDENGRPTEWSKAAHWRQAPVFDAHWIAADATDEDAGDKPLPLFRKGFELPGRVKRAVLYASGLGQDEVRINGQKVGDDELTPGWSDYRKTIYYDSYDVTTMLHAGANAVGVMVGNGMYRVLKTPGRYLKFSGSYGPPMCLVQLLVELADGSHLEVASDGSWKTAPGPITFHRPTVARTTTRGACRKGGTEQALTIRRGRRRLRLPGRVERCGPRRRMRFA